MSSERGRREANTAAAVVLVLGVSAILLPLFPAVLAVVNTVAVVVGGVVVVGVIAMVVRDVWS